MKINDEKNVNTIEWLASVPEEYRYRALIRKLAYDTRLERIPLTGSFELTPCCNLACKMCYVRLTKEEQQKRGSLLTTSQWLHLAEQARDAGTYSIQLTGGEAMLRPDFKEILVGISEMGVCVDVLSNGVLIDDEMIDFLCSHPPKNIQITLYGFSNEQYETVCGNGAAFDRVMCAIEKIQAANLPLSLATTLMKDSNEDYLAIHRYAAQRGIRHIVGAYLHQPRENKAIDINDVRIDSTKYLAIENKLREVDKHPVLKPCTDDVPRRNDFTLIEKGFLCGGGRNSFHINWRGEMQTCPAFDVLKSFPLMNGLYDAWCNLVEQVDEVKALSECQDCAYRSQCTTCAAIHYGDTKEFGKVSPRICLKKKFNL